MKRRAVLIDVDYVVRRGKGTVRLILKGKRFFKMYDPDFKPYFYIDSEEKIDKGKYGNIEIVDIQTVKKFVGRKEKELQKITCSDPREVPILSEILGRFGRVYETGIKFGRRYIMDNNLRPMNEVEIEYEGKNVKSVSDVGESKTPLNTLAFDIEVYNPQGVPREDKDEVIIISYSDGKEDGAITWKDCGNAPNAQVVENERAAIERFCEVLEEKDTEVLVGYNSSMFDIPYMKARADALGIRFPIGRSGKPPVLRKFGMTAHVKLEGRIHFDAYYSVRILAAAQALKLQRHTLEEVYREMIGGEPWKVDSLAIFQMWDDHTRRKALVEYAMKDSHATAEIFERLMPLQIELSRLTRLPLSQISGATTGQLVEALLMNEAVKEGIIIPPKPGETLAGERHGDQIQGAYVKLPNPGIYENIAVFDFRSLYPSILTSHNVDPETLNCGHEECKNGKNVSPLGHYFCMKKPGLVPSTMRSLLDRRKTVKAQLKNATGYDASILNARVAAMKIVLNTAYGMLNYARARWYSRESAEAITAWGRYYVQDVVKKAEEAGYTALYADTDSIFLLMGERREKDAIEFMDSINKTLPDTMELELEDIYTRGVFVSKKHEKEAKGAKKKYALINRKGKIKIRGFELVRRDWSKVAKDTQLSVLKAILEEGSKEKAIQIVKDVVRKINDGEIDKKDLVIYTQLRKSEYVNISPELAAVEKARKRGMNIGTGAIIGYIVTRNGKSISERAELEEFAKDYDPSYYIDHQILPAVMRIIGELGYTEDDIKFEGRQSSLGGWM